MGLMGGVGGGGGTIGVAGVEPGDTAVSGGCGPNEGGGWVDLEGNACGETDLVRGPDGVGSTGDVGLIDWG